VKYETTSAEAVARNWDKIISIVIISPPCYIIARKETERRERGCMALMS
jgi:hypothetical protein